MTFVKPKRKVTRVFVHCSASDYPQHDNVATIDRWHRERGWSGIGYHYFITKGGVVEKGRDLELTPIAQAGHNTGTIAICLHGLKKEKFTAAQFHALNMLCQDIDPAYGNNLTFHGHCEVAQKACPVFDYRKVMDLDKGGNPLAKPTEIAVVAGGIAAADPDDDALPNRLIKVAKKFDQAAKDLQSRLKNLGYDPGKIDGWFGEKTEAAVIAFQKESGLTPDGKVGALTREALHAARKK